MQLHDLLGDHLDHEDRGDLGVEVRSIIHDSRAATAGSLFCCITGAQSDGHDFAPAAVAAGACACLVERFVPVDVVQVKVESVRHAIGPLAARFHGYPARSMRVLGVTGTNGKTTTTYLLESIARAAGDRAAVIGTTGARIDGRELPLRHTTPEATELQALLAQMRDDAAQTVAMEVSSHALDQHRVDGTWFAAACFTNLSHDHLDYHGTLDAYFDAKARLFTPEFTEHTVVGVDDEPGGLLVKRAQAAGVTVRTYGIDEDADVTAQALELAADHSQFVLEIDGSRVPVRTPLVGRFNIQNALAAATTARVAGFDLDAVHDGLQAPIVVPGRMERIGAPGFTVLVDYAHTPDALAAVLDAARALVARSARLIVVYGCGGDRDRAKRPLMGAVVAERADRAFLTSDNPRSEDPAAIAADVLAGVDPERAPAVELDRRCAIRAAVNEARAGDVVVIAGKGHEPGQTTRGVTTPFDDRAVVREELDARS